MVFWLIPETLSIRCDAAGQQQVAVICCCCSVSLSLPFSLFNNFALWRPWFCPRRPRCLSTLSVTDGISSRFSRLSPPTPASHPPTHLRLPQRRSLTQLLVRFECNYSGCAVGRSPILSDNSNNSSSNGNRSSVDRLACVTRWNLHECVWCPQGMLCVRWLVL